MIIIEIKGKQRFSQKKNPIPLHGIALHCFNSYP